MVSSVYLEQDTVHKYLMKYILSCTEAGGHKYRWSLTEDPQAVRPALKGVKATAKPSANQAEIAISDSVHFNADGLHS